MESMGLGIGVMRPGVELQSMYTTFIIDLWTSKTLTDTNMKMTDTNMKMTDIKTLVFTRQMQISKSAS